MKDYPYFKFTSVNWLAGTISDLLFIEQGIFAYICSVYWESNCNLSIDELKQKLSKKKHLLYDEKHLLSLIENGCIKIENEKILIHFLIEQKEQINLISSKRSVAGSLGGRGNKAKAKQKKAKESKCFHNREEEKELDKEKELIKIESIKNPFSDSFLHEWERWLKYKFDQFKFKYKSKESEQVGIDQLFKMSNGNENTAKKIIEQSIANGWKGFFELKETSTKTKQQEYDEALKNWGAK